MGYGGRPSSGCHTCRKRKVKCDQRENGCGNCERAKQACPGYRNQIDLLFRYENDSIVKKLAKADALRKARLSNANGRVNVEIEASLLNYLQSPSIDERALGFFFHHYVAGSDKVSASGMNDLLLSAVKTVGIVGVSRAAGGPSITPTTQQMYLAAISKTNQALRSNAVTEDSTLVAVMLLGMFESMTGSTKRAMDSWEDHIKGATALLELRGPRQLDTPDGTRLFMHATMNLVANCLRQTLPLPAYILEVTAELSSLVDQVDPEWRYFQAHVLTTQFFTTVWRSGITDPEAIVRKALELDMLCLSIFSGAAPEWTYCVFPTEQTDDVIPNYFHIYENYVSVQMWNGMRVMRLLLHEVICNVFSRLKRESIALSKIQETQACISRSLLYEIHSQILATVPQHLGQVAGPGTTPASGHLFIWSNFRKRTFYPIQGADSTRTMLSSLFTFGGHTLPWGLYLIGNSEIAAPAVRAYVRKVLRTLGEQLGVMQAVYLAEDL